MKRLIISEEEKKRIRLLYESSDFVNTINRILKVNPQDPSLPYDALDWSTKTEEDPQRKILGDKFPDVKKELQGFVEKAKQEKTDLTQTITTLNNLTSGNDKQNEWKNEVLKKLNDTKQKIDNPQDAGNTQNTGSTQNQTLINTDWRTKVTQTFGI